jgi:hypothetical protein
MVVKVKTIQNKLEGLKEASQNLKSALEKNDETEFKINLKEYQDAYKGVLTTLKKHIKEDEPSPQMIAMLNEYDTQPIFSTKTSKKNLSSLRSKEPEALKDIQEGKTFSEFVTKDFLNDFSEKYSEIGKNEPFINAIERQLMTESTEERKTEEQKTEQKEEEKEEQKEEEKEEEKKEEDDDEIQVMEVDEEGKTEPQAPAEPEIKAEEPENVREEEEEKEEDKYIPPVTAYAPPAESTQEEAPPAMLINGEQTPMFQPETKIYQEQSQQLNIPQITQQQINQALDINSEESRITREERDRQQSNIQTLKKEIDAMHLVYNDFIEEFRTAQHKKEYSDALKSQNIDEVMIHHRKMKRAISQYYKTTDLKVGVIVSAGSLFQQYNNDLRSVLGTASAGLAQQSQMKKIEKGKEEIQKPAEIRPKQAIGGYANAMRKGMSGRIPRTKTKETINYKLTPDDMVKQYSSKRPYVVPSRMYNVPENIFVKSKTKK